MICPKCGRTVPDGAPCPCGAPVLSSNPAVNLMKTLGSSPKFLTAAILCSVTVLFNLLASFGASDVISTLYYYGANYGFDPDVFYPMMSALEGSTVVSAVIGAIPSILLAVLHHLPQHPKRQCLHRGPDHLQSYHYHQPGASVLRGIVFGGYGDDFHHRFYRHG